jgi:integrase
MKLTKTGIENFQMPPGKKEHWERIDGIPNFYMRVLIAGSKSLVHSYKFAGKTRKTWFGSATEVNISKTCEAARDLNARVRLGHDPVGERDIAKIKAAQTFGTIVPRFLHQQRDRRRNPHSYKDQQHHMLVHAKMLHGLSLEKVARRDIATCIAAVAENSGGRTGNQVRASLNTFFVWAMTQGLVDHNPVIGTLRNPERARDRVLTPAELRLIWENLSDDQYAAVVKLLMLTGQRAAEIGELRWSEVDFNTNVILLPGSRTKNGRPHTIPLSELARGILTAQPRRPTADGTLRDLVFGLAGEFGFSNWSKSKLAIDARIEAATGQPLPPWRIHDLRRSFVTHCAEIGIAPHIIEAAVNHVSGHRAGVAGTYNRALYTREIRIALDRWAEWLTAIIEGRESNIVALPQPA